VHLCDVDEGIALDSFQVSVETWNYPGGISGSANYTVCYDVTEKAGSFRYSVINLLDVFYGESTC
jgi:hypothetical protein